MKTGRNALCPCGSGKKFKRCCIDGPTKALGKQTPEMPSFNEIRRILAEKQREEAGRVERYGHVRAPVTFQRAGHPVVVAGNRLLTDKRWKTFHDFLFTYIGTLIEQDWFRTEAAKPVEQRHPLMQWYQVLDALGTWREHPRGEMRKVSSPPALVSALLSFSYEIYTLENYGLLTERLLSRLKRVGFHTR